MAGVTARLPLLVAALLASLVLVSGCATFPDQGAREWRPKAEGEGELGGPPALAPTEEPPPSTPAPPQQQPGGQPPPPGPCEDPDPQVVAACLGPVGAVAVLPAGDQALVAERRTGQVLQVRRDADPVPVATVPVDPATGVSGLVLSPGYAEDRLLYVLAGTPDGGQVLRIAPGEPPKPVLTGLPNTAGGALAVDADGSSLLVATGAGEGPLAGAVLRIDTLGRPAPGNPDPASPVLARGLTDPGGVCVDPAARTTWVTDRTPARDVLYQVSPGRLGAPAWTWPDRPGVAGCTVLPGTLVVAQRTAEALFVLTPGRDGGFTGDPKPVLEQTYGAIGPVTMAPDGLLWLGTVNRDGAAPGRTDDRVIRIQPPTGGGESAA
ncbi:Glucose/arabinose dehydrogenase, beta-propeller fold [Pseudonocardia ammonioxydans]|uniref:Glucose/arabinose dehydrogenase, beta-propeller fold n=1 Tax=Pseudonocardia ammonioxydans TaxID=260086 RepID=A0A1I5CNN2_PSUAM|nr:Glucose/arabinose dehydrogenase, beta-propeller fold [Pseudonocardia ammonioxydans]